MACSQLMREFSKVTEYNVIWENKLYSYRPVVYKPKIEIKTPFQIP